MTNLFTQPSELIPHMRKLEKAKAVAPQISGLQRDYNKLLAERRAKESLFEKLSLELTGMGLSSRAEEANKATVGDLTARLQEVMAMLDTESQYTKTLEVMLETKAKNIVFMRRPIAELRTQVTQLRSLGEERERDATRWSRMAKSLRDQQREFGEVVRAQQTRREKMVEEDVNNARLRKEFEACTERYRDYTSASARIESNLTVLSQLHQDHASALQVESLTEELHHNEAYIARQDANLEKMRRAVFIAKVGEIGGYFEYLKDTEGSLMLITNQLMEQIAHGREEVDSLNCELDIARKDESTNQEPVSTAHLEELLHSKQTRLNDLEEKVRIIQIKERETQVVSMCEVATRLERMVTGRPLEVQAVTSSTLSSALLRIESSLASLL